MKKFVSLILFLALTLSSVFFVSCGADTRNVAQLMNSDLRAEIVIKNGNGTARATLTASAYGGDVARDASLDFSSPDSLRGLTVTREGGKLTATLDGLCVPFDGGAAFLGVAELFTVTEEITSVKRCVLDGTDADLVNYGEVSLYVSKGGTPLFVTDGDVSVKILAFEALD